MLVDNLKTLQGSSLSFYLKIANFHWNIEGPDFPQYHAFLGDFYTDVFETVDRLAEYIRTLDSYAPGSLSKMSAYSIVGDYTGPQITSTEVFNILFADGTTLMNFYKDSFKIAELENEQGIGNFLAEQIDALGKRLWMIRSILKTA